MVVLQFHVSPDVMRQIRQESEATGKSISEVSREWLLKGKLETDKMRNATVALTVLAFFFPLVVGVMSLQLIWI